MDSLDRVAIITGNGERNCRAVALALVMKGIRWSWRDDAQGRDASLSSWLPAGVSRAFGRMVSLTLSVDHCASHALQVPAFSARLPIFWSVPSLTEACPV